MLPTPNGLISPHPAPAGPSAGTGPHPKISTGEMMTCAITAPTMTAAGRPMLPVPRTALPSRFSMQMDTAPPKVTCP